MWPAARPLPPRLARSLRFRGEKQKDQRTGQTAEHRRGGAWAGKGENPIAGSEKRALACARRGGRRETAKRCVRAPVENLRQPSQLSLPGPLCGGMLAEPRELSCMASNDAARRGCASAKTEKAKIERLGRQNWVCARTQPLSAAARSKAGLPLLPLPFRPRSSLAVICD